jgi:spermidine synthase
MSSWTELAHALTASGDMLVLRERAGCIELRCNGWDLMSNRAHHSEEVLAALACARLASHVPAILIGGLGFGYTLRAVLDRAPRSARITVAELIPEIIAWNRGPLAGLAGHPLEDSRVTVACTDVAALLYTAAPSQFHAILLDTDNGPDAVMLPDNAGLYAAEGLARIRRALRPDGVLAVWSADRSPTFAAALHAAGFHHQTHDIPARGAADDPLHTIYLAWPASAPATRSALCVSRA